REVTDDSDAYEENLRPTVRHTFAEQDGPDRIDVQREPLEEQQRQEVVSLILHELRGYALATVCAFRSEREHAGFRIGILPFLIRVRMMPVVLVHPPPVAETREKPREH